MPLRWRSAASVARPLQVWGCGRAGVSLSGSRRVARSVRVATKVELPNTPLARVIKPGAIHRAAIYQRGGPGPPTGRGVVRDRRRRLAEGWSGTADWIPGSCHGAGSRVTAVKDLAFGNVFAIGGAGADDRCTSTRGSDEWQRSNRLRRPYCRAHAQLARQLHVGRFRGLVHPRNNCMRIHPGSDLTARGNLNIN